MLFKIDINYVEDILSLNIQKFKEAWSELDWRNIDELDKSYHTEEVIWEWKDLNIILVFDESISAIDSANVGWNDKMPKFDEIQKDGITFTNFVTNWTTSDTAHISTLLWVIPLINMRLGNTPYSWYKLKMQALPEFMNSQWYKTTFISAVSLDFLKQREFLSWAWFQKIIWEEEEEEIIQEKGIIIFQEEEEEIEEETIIMKITLIILIIMMIIIMKIIMKIEEI